VAFEAITLAAVSVVPPAEKLMINLTGFVGYSALAGEINWPNPSDKIEVKMMISLDIFTSFLGFMFQSRSYRNTEKNYFGKTIR